MIYRILDGRGFPVGVVSVLGIAVCVPSEMQVRTFGSPVRVYITETLTAHNKRNQSYRDNLLNHFAPIATAT